MHSRYERFTPPCDASERRVDEIIAALDLEEKLELLGGEHSGTQANESKGVPKIKFADGPVGVHWWCETSTAYPATISLAASWDVDLAYRFGEAIGRDARARGVHVLLGPGVNIYRSPLCGRNFEYLGEDPHLASAMVVPYTRGCQDQGVSVTVKHYAVNFQEYDRHGVSSDVDERTLHEVYLPAFRAAVVDGGAGAIMTAYNLVNGVHCSEHDYLIKDVLRGRWGFDGLVMSDWASTYDAVRAANGGLDLEMPHAKHMNPDGLRDAVANGVVDEATIDDKLRRLLRLAACFGWLDREQTDASIPHEDERSAEVALEVARSGVVLLKNDGALPLDASALAKIAVIGPSAHPAVIGGGGSAYTAPWRSVSMLEGIEAESPDGVAVVHAVGVDPGRHNRAFRESAFSDPDGAPGLRAEYFNNLDLAGEPDLVRTEEVIDHRWMTKPPAEGIDKARHSIRWTGTLRVETCGEYIFYQLASDGEYLARIGEQVLFDTWGSEESGPASGRVTLETGRDYDVLLQYRPVRGWNSFCFGYEPVAAIEADAQAALDAAEGADAVIYCGGHTRESEGEGFDRSFGIAAEQQELIRKLGETSGKLVFVLTAGGNVDMAPWIDSVDALLHAWYPGQEGGQAVAEIVLGKVNPSGKLPATFEARLEDRSSFACYHDDDHDKRVALSDGVFTGYRHADAADLEPRFALGYGLSYTTFAMENLRLSAGSVSAEESLAVTFDVINTGPVAGAEVAQVYVSDAEASVPRPPKELKGFVKVPLQPGERKTVSVPLDARAWSFFDPTLRDWVVEPGAFRVLVGSSARDIRLEADLVVRG